MNREKFIEKLQLYGSDLSTWPEEVRDQALTVYQNSTEIKGLVDIEKEFETLLLERNIENPSSDFERRITLSAKPRSAGMESVSVFSNVFDLINIPKPALTIVFLLLFGFTIGFFYDTYADSGDIELSEFLYFDEGEYHEQ